MHVIKQTFKIALNHKYSIFALLFIQAHIFEENKTPVSSINKTDRYDITEILLNAALNTITLTLNYLMC
jgi:hypothetical protein